MSTDIKQQCLDIIQSKIAELEEFIEATQPTLLVLYDLKEQIENSVLKI